jgi:Escherichia/Staphylococcus phage prohead protease
MPKMPKPKNNIIYRDEKRQIEFDRLTNIKVMELRAEEQNEKRVLTGLAAVFGQVANIGGWFEEKIRAGAFTKTLTEFDQVALWNHDDSKPLGRRSTGTLTLTETKRGLEFTLGLGGQSWATDAWESVQRGDVGGMSFGFRVTKHEWTEAKTEGGLDLREIIEAQLYEVSLVTFPAYEGASVEASARSIIECAQDSGELINLFSPDTTDASAEEPAASADGTDQRTDQTATESLAGPGNTPTTDTTGQPEPDASANAERNAGQENHLPAGLSDNETRLRLAQAQTQTLEI